MFGNSPSQRRFNGNEWGSGMTKSDLVLAQVAPEDADGSLERASVENSLERVFLEPFVDRDVDG
jgi:hypothetical protein